MRKLIAALAAVCVLTFSFAAISGCADDVKTVKKVETQRESQPQMVSPGEPIVE
ncbi:MAG: hypothetical protein GY842_03970 [bacterium]|nr:hypothetical protein [bacterium]